MPGFNFPIVDTDRLSCTIACYNGSQVGLNILHFIVGASGAPTIDTVAIPYDAALAAVYKPWLAADSTFWGTKWRNLSTPTAAPYTVTSHSGIGTTAGATGPGQASGIITKDTPVLGRPGRGRMYVPFIPVSAMFDANKISPAAFILLDAIAALANTTFLIAGVAIAPIIFRNLTDFTSITDWTTRLAVATQKRRGSYGRVNHIPPW